MGLLTRRFRHLLRSSVFSGREELLLFFFKLSTSWTRNYSTQNERNRLRRHKRCPSINLETVTLAPRAKDNGNLLILSFQTVSQSVHLCPWALEHNSWQQPHWAHCHAILTWRSLTTYLAVRSGRIPWASETSYRSLDCPDPSCPWPAVPDSVALQPGLKSSVQWQTVGAS